MGRVGGLGLVELDEVDELADKGGVPSEPLSLLQADSSSVMAHAVRQIRVRLLQERDTVIPPR